MLLVRAGVADDAAASLILCIHRSQRDIRSRRGNVEVIPGEYRPLGCLQDCDK